MIDFNQLIDKHIFREHKPKQIGRYYPSEVGRCIRKTWYTYKHPTEIEPDLRKIFELGNILHDFVVEVLRSERTPEVKLLQAEMPFKIPIEDFIISGRVDELILLRTDKRKLLVEVKSCRSIRRAKPHRHHKTQLQFYMYATGVHNGLLLYVDKATLKTKQFAVKFSMKQAKRILKKFKSLHKHLVADKLPVAEAKKQRDMKWMCRYCEYKEKCGKNEK